MRKATRKQRRLSRRFKRFVLITLAYIAGFNFIVFACLIDALTRDGWILALIVNSIGGSYLFALAYANGWIYNTEPYFEREEYELEQRKARKENKEVA